MLVFLGAENGNALLKVVFGASIGKHGLGLCINGDFLARVDGAYAHGRPKAYAVVVLGYSLAHARIDSVNEIALKGYEQTKVVLPPVSRDTHVGVLDILEHRAHIGKHTVAFGLSIPFVK